jgi:acyl carrier protein
MTEEQAFEQITAIVRRMLEDKGAAVPDIDTNTELLGGAISIDSLDLAMLVLEMENVAGFDPFAEGFIEFRTMGELSKLYAK